MTWNNFLHPKTSFYPMRPPLAEITHSNQGWRLLQIFRAKPFFIDRHARFTEELSSSVLYSGVSIAFFSMCVHMLKSMRVKSGDIGLLTIISYWRPTSLAQSMPCVPAPWLENLIWFLGDILGPWKNLHLQKFPVNGRV